VKPARRPAGGPITALIGERAFSIKIDFNETIKKTAEDEKVYFLDFESFI
jgi:hypothetical protein